MINKSLSDAGLSRLILHSKSTSSKGKTNVQFISCDDCEKAFTSNQGLVIHVAKAHKKYTTEKKCNVTNCDYKSIKIDDYKKHIESVHGKIEKLASHVSNTIKTQNSRIKCKYCKFTAPSRALLSYHTKTHNVNITEDLSNAGQDTLNLQKVPDL